MLGKKTVFGYRALSLVDGEFLGHHCTLKTVEEVDLLRRIRFGCCLPVGGGKIGKERGADGLAEEIFARTAKTRPCGRIGEIEIAVVAHMHVGDEFRHVADLFHVKQRGKGVGRDGCKDIQCVEQAEPGMAIIEYAFFAGAIIAIILEEEIEAGGGFFDHVSSRLIVERAGKGGQQNILRAPRRPVVHRLVAPSHPPEMLLQVGLDDAAADREIDPGNDHRRHCVHLFFEQGGKDGELRPGLRGEEIDHRAAWIGQRQNLGIADMDIVGRQLPAAFLDHQHCAVDDPVEIAPVTGHAFAQCQRVQHATALHIGRLVAGAVAVVGEKAR